ncbi:hypothetical protein BDR26DRAFT_894995 [Obelidium mucronatum]|nr:hypothetical protein BDR26DRAFT_894995 [Obelidium mucronatum]
MASQDWIQKTSCVRILQPSVTKPLLLDVQMTTDLCHIACGPETVYLRPWTIKTIKNRKFGCVCGNLSSSYPIADAYCTDLCPGTNDRCGGRLRNGTFVWSMYTVHAPTSTSTFNGTFQLPATVNTITTSSVFSNTVSDDVADSTTVSVSMITPSSSYITLESIPSGPTETTAGLKPPPPPVASPTSTNITNIPPPPAQSNIALICLALAAALILIIGMFGLAHYRRRWSRTEQENSTSPLRERYLADQHSHIDPLTSEFPHWRDAALEGQQDEACLNHVTSPPPPSSEIPPPPPPLGGLVPSVSNNSRSSPSSAGGFQEQTPMKVYVVGGEREQAPKATRTTKASYTSSNLSRRGLMGILRR